MRQEGEEAKSESRASPTDDRTSEITTSTKAPTRSSTRRGTGPRTVEGKERSKRNATRHGIFSSVVVLKGEDRAEYESLLNSLWEALRPEGGFEELLVEKLAIIAWRYRRLLVAEGAEIRTNTEFVEWDQRTKEQEEAEEMGTTSLDDVGEEVAGLIQTIRNPNILERCLELLLELRQGIATDGFREEHDTSILRKIYGNKGHLRDSLFDSYSTRFDAAEVSDEERRRERYATPDQCKQHVLDEIDAEIQRLKLYKKTRTVAESDRTKLEILRRSVPDSSGLDRLLRYEASLERAFDRTLNQLERLQRMRLGQPIAPRIDVNVSA